MPSTFLFRFSKMFLVSAISMAIGFGMVGHASAQKDGLIGGIGRVSSGLFPFGSSERSVILSLLSKALDAGEVDSLNFKNTSAMKFFYTGRNGKTVWIDSHGEDHVRAASVLNVLEKAGSHGLNPELYHVNEIRRLLSAENPSAKVQLELLVSDAVIRYVQDINGFHLPAKAIRQEASFWKAPEEAGSALAVVAASNDIEETLESYAPQDFLYKRLREDLVALANSPEGDSVIVSFGGEALRPGELHRNVARLRARMGVDYDPAYGTERKYDDRLAKSVMDFQRENGLVADGVIGPKTLDILNRSPRDKMEQIVANMERLRWINTDKPDRYILVNIPSATLWAIDHGNVALEMPVIVGRPERPTKSFTTGISGVRFNPKWTVPPTIKVQDFLPKLVEDPAYLQGRGIEVSALIDGERQILDSSAIDWANITRRDLAQLRMVQGAGENNALGQIRVLMDNPYDIYLHDTNMPEYFKKTERTLSSGCIRLSDPEAVAEFILKDNEGWSKTRMEKILSSGRTTEIPVTTKIPVYIVYQTIWLDDQDHLVYGPDVYKLDHQLIGTMVSLNFFHIQNKPDIQFAGIPVDSSVR